MKSPISLGRLSWLFSLLVLIRTEDLVNAKRCKAVPGSKSWPSGAQWKALNASLSGQLLAPLPPAAVCDHSLSVYNNASCSEIISKWMVSDFHAREPVSVDQSNWENDACVPGLATHCSLSQFPPYVVNATTSAHIQLAVNFARKFNVRLIVKGTGHDYLGRSVKPFGSCHSFR